VRSFFGYYFSGDKIGANGQENTDNDASGNCGKGDIEAHFFIVVILLIHMAFSIFETLTIRKSFQFQREF